MHMGIHASMALGIQGCPTLECTSPSHDAHESLDANAIKFDKSFDTNRAKHCASIYIYRPPVHNSCSIRQWRCRAHVRKYDEPRAPRLPNSTRLGRAREDLLRRGGAFASFAHAAASDMSRLTDNCPAGMRTRDVQR